MKLKCTYPAGLENYLTKNKIYLSIRETEHSYYIIDDSGEEHAWSKSRFEIFSIPRPTISIKKK